MKYEEQFFSTYEDAVRRIDAGFEICEDVYEPEDGILDDYSISTTLTLSATKLVMSDSCCYGPYDDPEVVRELEMKSGREGIAKLMFRYDIPIVRSDEGIDGEAMLEKLFEALSPISVVDLVRVFLDLNISFTYEA